MQVTVLYRKGMSSEYMMAIRNWAERLGAEEMTIWSDGSVDLHCSHGCICRNYKPTKKELYRKENVV